MAQRAVIFDFGGVLVKTRDYSFRHAWDEKLGLAHGSVERVVHGIDAWIAAQSGRIPVDAYWRAVAAKLYLTHEEARFGLARDFYKGDELDADVLAVVTDLHEASHTVALLSNDSPQLMDRLRAFDIVELFDPLVISGEIGVMKPAPAAYLNVLYRLNRPGTDCIFIDDTRKNMIGAQALGIVGVHYHDGDDLRAALSPHLETV